MIPTVDYIRVLPELLVTIFGIVVMLVDPLLPAHDSKKSLGIIALVGTLASLVATVYQTGFYGDAFFDMVRVDTFSIFFHIVVLLVVLVVVLSSFDYLEVQQIKAGEYYGLLLFAAVGMMLMSSAIELVLIFIAIEISSISSYVLAGFRRRAAESAESSLKYFLLGSFATAFFLYGVALVFGATGSTNVYKIAEVLSSQHSVVVYLAVALMFVGLGFKVASAPFHIWTPDVYEGAPAPVVGFLSTGPKAAAFAVLLRVLFATGAPGWFWMVWVSAVLSMTIGNIGALVQNNVKRLLAYSSIAHAGYLLVAFAAAQTTGISAAIFYAASYAAMNVGAFAIVAHLSGRGERYVTLDDYTGLGRRSPLIAGLLTVFLISLIGIPITGGFFAKFYVFSAALRANLIGLTIIGVINSAIAAYYYLRIIVYMYMLDESGQPEAPVPKMPASLGTAVAISLLATLYLGVLPDRVLEDAIHAAQDLVK
ncbi:MAG TPA: NADH-quinone oxidoreductase subunit N [Candidatus Binatia bacterium]|nr:NADH-quinone oxidoreductase subunit N [Candidatus Binatia bacterium]